MTIYQEHQEYQEQQEISSSFRLSPQQRLRWQSTLPTPMIVLDIQGTLDIRHWQQRLEALVADHEPLRARLHFQPGLKVPLQCISTTGVVNLATTPADIAAASPGQEQDEPAIQANLASLGENRHQLHLRLPLLSADRGTLLRLARALVAPTPRPENEDGNREECEDTPYSHYTAWLYELQEDDDAEAGRQYWARQCPAQGQSRGLVYRQDTGAEADLAELVLPADANLDRALASFCQTSGYSAETVLMTAWAEVLRRLSQDIDQDSVTAPLGWVHDCRQDYEELADTWGLFSKTLPLPWKAVPGEDFQGALSRMHGYQEEAGEWQEYYAIETDPAPTYCRFGFEWGGELDLTNDVSRPQVRISTLQTHTQWFELLMVPERSGGNELKGGFNLRLFYDTRSYTAQAATVLLEQYQSLLLDAVTNPDQALASLSLYSHSFETTLQSREPSGPWPTLDHEDLYPALFSRSAREHRDRPALVDSGSDTPLLYEGLEARVNQLAHYLCDQGMGAESRVALYLDRSAEMVVAILAVLKSGAAFVPLEIRQPAARTLAILEDARPDLVISNSAQPAPFLAGTNTLMLDAVALRGYPVTAPDVSFNPDQAAYLLFTSGSTGTPKGVVVAHRQLQNYISSILARVPLQGGEKSAIVTSLAADLSYTLLFTSLLTGGELHIIDRDTTLDPQAWGRYQQLHAIEHLKVVPSLLDAWLSHGDVNAVLPTRQLILGGEACKPTLLSTLRDQAPRLRIYNHYGPTEATVGVLMHKVGDSIPAQGLPLSERLDHTHIYILDDNLNPVGPGLAGELYIAGANLARGYLCPKQTVDRFIPNPFPNGGERLYRSGDLARYLPDGSIELLGRADRQVKIRGYRIELDEIETLLTGLPAVNQAAVVAVPRQQGDLQMFAFITRKPDQQTSLAQLQGQLQDRLPGYMVPTLRLVENLPLMASGKLDRQSLCQQATKLLGHSGSAPPGTPLEEQLAKLWAEALGLEKVGVNDDFFECGGHSLAAVKLASRLRTTLGMPIKVNMVFAAPTVAQFAQSLATTDKLSPLVPLSTSGDSDRPRLFCFHPSTGHLRDYRHLVDVLPHWHLWGLQASDMQQLPESLDALAAHYLSELRQQQPHGPYYLLGWSLGGLLAITVAGLLEQAGEDVDFLGVVDSQPRPDDMAQSIDQLLEWAEDEFDNASRQRLRHLPSDQHQALAERLDQAEPEEWPFVLLHWARQQGLQLENDSWQHAEERQHRHAHTQRLIGSFNPPLLRCPVTAWWARDTLATGSTPPADWQKLTERAVIIRTIDSYHFDILHKTDWQQQLCEGLDQAVTEPST